MRRKRKVRRFVMPEVSLTPLIDTALTLLIIFIVAAPMMNHSIKVNLPKGSSQDMNNQKALIVISVLSNGSLLLNDTVVEKENLITAVKECSNATEATSIYLHGDAHASYGSIMNVFDTLKKASIKSVVLSLKRDG